MRSIRSSFVFDSESVITVYEHESQPKHMGTDFDLCHTGKLMNTHLQWPDMIMAQRIIDHASSLKWII